MVNLQHDSLIRLATWHTTEFAKVGVATTYAKDSLARMTDKEFYDWCVRNRDCMVFATFAGHTITSSKAFHEELQRQASMAIVVAHGDEVDVEGTRYRIKVLPGQTNGPKFSDPIKFELIRSNA